MTTDLEEDLRTRLQRHGHTLPTPTLEAGVQRRVRTLRHRRRAGLAAGLAALVVLPIAAWWTVPQLRFAPPPVAHTPAVGPQIPVDPQLLPTGPGPTLDYVSGHWWYRADPDVPGSVTTTAVDVTGSSPHALVAYRDTLFAQRSSRSGELDRYSLGDGPARTIPGAAASSVQPGATAGPDGSVLLTQEHGVLMLDRAGRWSRSPRFGEDIRADFRVPMASRHAWWTTNVAVDFGLAELSALTSRPVNTFPQWGRVVTSSPVADLVVADSGPHCQDVVDAGAQRSRWHTCDWKIAQLSPDGGFALATPISGGSAVVLDLITHQVAYELPWTYNPDISRFQFSTDGNLNIVLEREAADPSLAVVTCGPTGSCWRATPWLPDSIAFVQPNN